jgi:murein DD-endopeptidase MepM/ murein hydrolase activator NlpD
MNCSIRLDTLEGHEAMATNLLIQAFGLPLRPLMGPTLASSAHYVRTASPTTFSATLTDALRQADAGRRAAERYEVRKGDYLARIVQSHLKSQGGTPTNREVYEGVRQVARANGLANPDILQPGQKLDLSPLAPSGPVARPERANNAAAVTLRAPVRKSSAAYTVTRRTQGEGGPLVAPARAASSRAAALPAEPVRRTNLTELIDRILGSLQRPTASSETQWPVLGASAELSSGFGTRTDPFTGRPALHQGVDLATAAGTTVYPLKSGTVTFAGYDPGYGRMVVVKHDDGLESIYGHNAAYLVKIGDEVNAQTPLSQVGTTGRSTGPHLHLEVHKNGRPVDPMPYLRPQTEILARK